MSKKETFVILDNIRSRENVGSIFRTADATGVSKIYLCGITPTPQVGNPKLEILNPKQIPNSKFSRWQSHRGSSTESGQIQNQDKIAKTALGAEKWVPWKYHKQTWRLLKKLKSQGVNIIALEQTADAQGIFTKDISVFTRGTFALVLGNEVRGLSPKILKYCDKKISIPMYGKKESLNVAVAAGIAVYTLLNI